MVTFSIPLNDSVVESDETFLLAVNISGPATNLERDINITVQDFPGTAIRNGELCLLFVLSILIIPFH